MPDVLFSSVLVCFAKKYSTAGLKTRVVHRYVENTVQTQFPCQTVSLLRIMCIFTCWTGFSILTLFTTAQWPKFNTPWIWSATTKSGARWIILGGLIFRSMSFGGAPHAGTRQTRPAKERKPDVESFAGRFSKGGRKIFRLASSLKRRIIPDYGVVRS